MEPRNEHVDNPKFKLDSSQCELLMAFESARSLNELASMVTRDVSVVSRQLQRLAESAPVLQKQKGRWQITELGRQMNNWSRSAAGSQAKILEQHSSLRFSQRKMPSLVDQSALIVVGVQRGFDDPLWGPRNNLDAEANIEKLLDYWRKAGRQIFHIQHQSTDPNSPLRAGSMGADFKEVAKPAGSETIIRKGVNSGFIGTDLDSLLRKQKLETLVIVGLSLNHCVDATVRTASDLGFNVYVVSDAIAAFDRIGPDGRRIKADDIQAAVLANLNQEFAVIVHTDDLLRPPKFIDA